MSTGYFFSNPVQPQAPINNNIFLPNGNRQDMYNEAQSNSSNNMMQHQLNPQQIQQLINQQQMNQQNNQYVQPQQQQQQQQQVQQQQVQTQHHHQYNPQLMQQQVQQLLQNQYQQQQGPNQMGMNQTSTLSSSDINSIKALFRGQNSVPNPVPNPMIQVNNNTTNGSAAAATQPSFFGNLLNQLNFLAANNNSSMNSSNNTGNYTNGNMLVANPLQNSTNMSQMATFGKTREMTPTVSLTEADGPNQSFMTPRMSLTPDPPTNPPTPMMMTPRMGMTPDPLAETPAPPLGSLNAMNEGYQHTNALPFSIGTSDSKGPTQKKAPKAASASTIANAQKSFFRRGMTSVGSALTVVANYINESLLSGIPFHIADRAMRDSKALHAKWWEDGINNDGDQAEENPDEITADDSSNREHVEKKRKLDSGEALSTQSALSASLEKNYNAVGVDTTNVGRLEDTRRPQDHVSMPPSMPHSKHIEVDSSIIKRRRSQFEHANEQDDFSGMGGYDIFNNVGCMYGRKDPEIVSSNHESNDTPVLPELFAQSATTTATTIKSNSAIEGTMHAIKELFEEKNNVEDERDIYHMISSPRDWVTRTLRSELIDALQNSHGDTKDKRFLSSLEVLSRFYKSSGRDARVNPWSVGSGDGRNYAGGPIASDLLEGSWVNMSRPNYVECLGKNKENDFMYTLGRMSFDMFQPGDLICSVQSTHNNIRIVGEQEELPAFVPKSLKEEVMSLSKSDGDSTSKRPLLRSYDINVSITLEPPASVEQPEPSGIPSPAKRLRAVIAVKGYVLPDPHIPNRLTVWFTGGKLCPAMLANDDDDMDEGDEKGKSKGKKSKSKKKTNGDDDEYGGFEEWSALFSKGKWRKTLGERARAMAAKLLLGAEIPNKMEDNGHMEYSLHRPVGGHSKVYVEVMYLDEDILIMRGHRGTIYAMARSCVSQRYRVSSQDDKKAD